MAKQKARKITDAPIGCTHPAFLVEDGKCKGCGKPLEQQAQTEGPPTVCEKADECIHAGDDCTQKGAEERAFGCFEVEPMARQGNPPPGVGEDGEEIELPPLNICEKTDCHAYEPTAANHCKVYHSGTDAAQCDKFTKGATGEIPQSTFSSSDTSAPFDRELPVQIPDDELAERGAEMARLIEVWTKAKLDKKAQDQAFKRLIDETEEKYVALAEEVRAGTEVRPVPCYWQFDPAHMSKRLIRCDTGALVEERAMELLDLEQCPNHQAKASVQNAEGCLAGNAETDETADDALEEAASDEEPFDDYRCLDVECEHHAPTDANGCQYFPDVTDCDKRKTQATEKAAATAKEQTEISEGVVASTEEVPSETKFGAPAEKSIFE